MKHVEIELMQVGTYKLFIDHQFVTYGTMSECLEQISMAFAAQVPSDNQANVYDISEQETEEI